MADATPVNSGELGGGETPPDVIVSGPEKAEQWPKVAVEDRDGRKVEVRLFEDGTVMEML